MVAAVQVVAETHVVVVVVVVDIWKPPCLSRWGRACQSLLVLVEVGTAAGLARRLRRQIRLAVGLLPEAQAASAARRDQAVAVGTTLVRRRCSVCCKATLAATDRPRVVVVVVGAQQRQAETQ